MINRYDLLKNDTAQMMTIEAFLGALLIVAALLFVVSQAPSGIQQSNPHSKTQLYLYGDDAIKLLKDSELFDNSDYDNLLQYYIAEIKFDELDAFINNTLPDNVGYNVDIFDGTGFVSLVRNGYPTGDSVTVNELVAIKLAPFGGIGPFYDVPPWYFTDKAFDNGSLIIPMDNKQNNNITAYNLIMKISDQGIPVYQLLQDPSKDSVANDSRVIFNTTYDAWNPSEKYDNIEYNGGPYVISAHDLTPIIENQIKEWADNPIEFPSSKIDKIEFDQDMDISGEEIKITFTLNDSSSITVNLSTDTDSTINFDDYSVLNAGDNYSQFLEFDATGIAFDDKNDREIIGIVLINRASFDLTISNVTFTWTHGGGKLINFSLDGNDYTGPWGSSTTIELGPLEIAHNDPARKVTVHRAGESFSYLPTTWLTRPPRIAAYPKAGTMTNYYSDSGISYTVLDNDNILNGDLRNYDFLFVPHVNISMPDDVVRNVIDWVSDGGTLLAECNSIKEIDNRVQAVDDVNHSWWGFIGIGGPANNSNDIKFIGITTLYDYFERNLTTRGANQHPLAQSYTVDGTLPGTEGDTPAYVLKEPDINYNNSIMAVPLNNSDLDLYKITYMESEFDGGTVIYLGGHDQSRYSQQRERLIFNSILYSTTAKVYSYGLAEVKITMWYK